MIKKVLERRYENEILGAGNECIVVLMQGDEKKVAAYRYSQELDLFEAKKTFYLHRIFSTLFPHNFPRFYGSFASRKNPAGELELPGGTIRQKIEGETKPRWADDIAPLRAVMNFIVKPKIKYPFKEAEKKCLEMGFVLPAFDMHAGNFIYGVDGGEYFVDTIWYFSSAFNIDRVTGYMTTHGYTQTEIDVVRTSFERLRFLETEEEKKASTRNSS